MLIYTRQTAWSSPNVGWPMNHPRILNTGQRWLAMNTGRLLMLGLPSVTQAMASNGLFLEVFRAVAWGMNEFLNHSLQRKSSIHPFSDMETLDTI